MTQAEPDPDLDRECETLCRYLVGRPPSAAVKAHYQRAHAQGVVAPPGGLSPRDRRLVQAARAGGLSARTADIYARFFVAGGWLRRKLVLLVALLETDPQGRALVDRVHDPSLVRWLLRTTWAGLVSVALLAVGVVRFAGASARPEEGPR